MSSEENKAKGGDLFLPGKGGVTKKDKIPLWLRLIITVGFFVASVLYNMRLRNSTSPKEKETTLQQEFREALLAGDKEFTWELSLNLMDGTSFGIIILILVIWLVVRGFFHRDRFVFLRLIPPIFLIFQVSLIFMVNASSLTDKSIIPVLTNEGYSVSTLYHLNEDNPSILVVTDLEDSEVIHRVEISYGIDGEPNSVKIPTALSEEFKLKASTK